MNQAIGSNPDLVLFCDPFQLMRVAQEDVKLAETLFRQCQKKMLLHQQMVAQQNQQQTINGQIAAAQSAEQEKRKSLQDELEVKQKISDAETSNKLKEMIGTGLLGILQKGLPIPTEWKGVETEFIQNIGLPLFAQNVARMAELSSQMQPQQQEEDQEQVPEQQQINQPPQEQAA